MNYKTTVMVMSMAIMIAGMSLVPVLTQQTAAAAIYCNVGVGCHGTDNRDIIIGTSSGDAIFGWGGNDSIYGFGGADDIYGGDGNDKLYHNSSASGSDSDDDDLYGQNGTDKCYRNSSDGDSTSSCETIINW